jgi:transaldolase
MGAALEGLTDQIFADNGDCDVIARTSGGRIKGATTNPALMHAAGVSDHRLGALIAFRSATGRPESPA